MGLNEGTYVFCLLAAGEVGHLDRETAGRECHEWLGEWMNALASEQRGFRPHVVRLG